MEKTSSICRMCCRLDIIRVGNVCDHCHTLIESVKGTPLSFSHRRCYYGMYCLRCKYVVNMSEVNLNTKTSCSYCKSCESKFVCEAYKKRMNRQRNEILRNRDTKSISKTARKIAPKTMPKIAPKIAPKAMPKITIDLTQPESKTGQRITAAAKELAHRLTIRTATASFIEEIEMDMAANLLIAIQPRARSTCSYV